MCAMVDKITDCLPQVRLGKDFIKCRKLVRILLISRVDKGGVKLLQDTPYFVYEMGILMARLISWNVREPGQPGNEALCELLMAGRFQGLLWRDGPFLRLAAGRSRRRQIRAGRTSSV